MIKEDDIPELGTYHSFERGMPFAARQEYQNLVVFGENELEPIHNWFRFKEGFSAKLLDVLLREYDAELPKGPLTILDPFCGSGTTLLSAIAEKRRSVNAVGIERSPLIHFIAQTKCSWQSMDHSSLCRDGIRAIDLSRQLNAPVPKLSSISTGRCISRYVTSRLTAIDEAAKQFSVNSPFLRLGIAASVEPLSKVRRDGRALRLTKKPPQRIDTVLLQNWQRMASDAASLSKQANLRTRPPIVHLGDGRNPSISGIPEKSIDLILTSPPYPNNIDYSEVYKLELWILGFIKTQAEFLNLRHSTLRSHPTFDKSASINEAFLREVNSGTLKDLLGSMISRLEMHGEKWRARMVLAYFSDIWAAIMNYKRLLRRKGIIALVVGNSLHGTTSPAMIATDLVIAQIGRLHGFEPSISVARGLRRRLAGNHFLRESIVVLRNHDAG